jgi:DNA-directed RNA polymerase subunit alpha
MEYKLPKIKFSNTTDLDSKIVVSPLNSGYGTTVGNALRRVLLSSIPGYAIVGFKIDGIKHEFDTIEGVREDVLEVLLNLKQIDLKIIQNELSVKVKVKKSDKLTTSDFGNEVEVFGEEKTILTFNEPTDFEMDILIRRGVGYQEADELKADMPVGYLAIDAIYSPIKKVSYIVDKTRIGKDANYDLLEMDIQTNGSVSAAEAIATAGKILVEHFSVIQEFEKYLVEEEIFVEDVIEEEEEVKVVEINIEELGLSSRSLNALYKHNITTLSQLSELSIDEIKSINNLGVKSQTEIIEKLQEHGIEL